MAAIREEKVSGEIEGEFVVFLLGMRIHKLRKVRKWLPIVRATKRMLDGLENDPESGLLGHWQSLGIRDQLSVQYWRSFGHLRDFAWDADTDHPGANVDFYQNVGHGDDVGIWHEVYVVSEHGYEAVYQNMPPHGLGAAGDCIPATGRRMSAAGRMGLSDGTDIPILVADPDDISGGDIKYDGAGYTKSSDLPDG